MLESLAFPIKSWRRTPPFVNGTFGHDFKMEDAYAPALAHLAHPRPAVVSAALAFAERDGCSGEDLQLSVVAVYEVMGRYGYGLSPSQLYRGLHPTSALSPLGSVAAGSRTVLLKKKNKSVIAAAQPVIPCPRRNYKPRRVTSRA